MSSFHIRDTLLEPLRVLTILPVAGRPLSVVNVRMQPALDFH